MSRGDDDDIVVEVNLSEVERAARENGAPVDGEDKLGPTAYVELADGAVIESLMECPLHRHLGPWFKTHGDGKHVLQDYRCGCRLVVGGALPGER